MNDVFLKKKTTDPIEDVATNLLVTRVFVG